MVRTRSGKRSSSSRRPKGRARKRRRLSSRKTAVALKPHTFVERLPSDTLTINTESAATGLFKSFNLDQIAQASHYKALFEYYTINKVVVEFRYKSLDPAYKGDASNYLAINEVNPVLYFKVDHNDISADTLSDMKESSKTREYQLSNSKPNFTIQLKPAVQAEAYKSSLTTTYIPKWGQQLSCVDGTVPHYGLKVYAIGHRDATWSPGSIEVNYKLYFTMKNNE